MSHSSSSRKQCDFAKLAMAGYDLELNSKDPQDFNVIFHGPKETLYEGGVWRIHVTLPDDYPFASPSVGFLTKIMHPNVDEASGSVCLDVINQAWTPLFSLMNVFEDFLPQLLTYPNPQDPLNSEAASLLNRDKEQYDRKVKEHVAKYASRELWEQEKARKAEAAARLRAIEADNESQVSELERVDENADAAAIEDL
ncbi:hypothetical protein Efla_005253 [Eimeria flavescens]